MRWGMRFNAKKCNIIHVSRNKPKHHFYCLCGEIIQEVEHAKYLGVTISANLKWEKHINGITSKANSTLNVINRTFRYSPESARQIVYFALVRSTIEYSCEVWDPHFKKDVDCLEMVNRRAAWIVKWRTPRYREVTVTALPEDLKWTSLQEHGKHLRLVLMYKIVNGLVAVPATQLTLWHDQLINGSAASGVQSTVTIAKGQCFDYSLSELIAQGTFSISASERA